MEAESPASIAPFSPAGTGSGRTGGLLRPCPRPVRKPWPDSWARVPAGCSCSPPFQRNWRDRDWQETDGFRWTALEAEGDHSLLDALTAQAAALWESGVEGPAVALVYP